MSKIPSPLATYTAVFVALISLTLAPMPAEAQIPDTGLYLSVIPPGQNGHLTSAEGLDFLATGTLPPNTEDQSQLYANMSTAPPGISDLDLLNYFKLAPMGPGETVQPIAFPRPGLSITRDSWGVPYIKAPNRQTLMYGIGYAQALDRLFAMDLLRHAGRGKVTELVGPIAFALSQDESLYQFAGYDEADLEQQYDDLITNGRGRGRRVDRDIESFIEGINAVVAVYNANPGQAPAEYPGLGLLPIQPWKKTDILSVAVQLEQLFGAGGGGEHRNSLLLQKLQGDLGATDGQTLYEDLRHREEGDASTTTEQSFPFLIQGAVDPAAVAHIDPGSVVQNPMVQVVGPLPRVSASNIDLSALNRPNDGHPAMSNFLGITANNAVGGHPIAVMGPQAGYFIPEILVEYGFEGAGMKARGVAPLGTPYVVLGRGRSYAWSATAGGSDNTDIRAELLCEPGGGAPTIMSTNYMFDGVCTPMFVRVDSWCAGDPTFCSINPDNLEAVVERTVHGLVFARATVGGQPVALAKERANFFREGENAIAFTKINRKTRSAKSFARAIAGAPGSFNWLYVNQDEISFFHSGLFPLRAPGVDYDMPSWGTGEWEWSGLVHRRDHPQEIDPAKGFFTSWNNKPAKDWSAADSNYSYAATHRVDSLDDRLEARLGGGPISVGEMVEMMGDAAHVDLRGAQVLPLALQIIGAEPSLAAELTLLDDWVTAGAFRRDRDDDGDYDNTNAVAIMDEWFERMIHAVFDPQLGSYYGDIPLGFDNKPGPVGSAYQSGYYGLLTKAFRTILGQTLASPLGYLQCADGTPVGCRAALVSSLGDTVAELTTQFGSADPADWIADPTVDQIEYSVFGIAEVDPIPWQNRPTYQQTVQVTSKKPQ